MPIGPKGEKRPVSAVQNAHRIFQIATGQAEEEYVDGKPWTDEEVAARRIASKTSKTSKPKKKKKAPKV